MAEAQSLTERKRKAGGMKEMLQEATKLTHKLRFLVEEVRDSVGLSDTDLVTLMLDIHLFSVCLTHLCFVYLHTAAPAHSAGHLRLVAEQQQACRVRSDPSQRPAVLQQPGGQRSSLWQDNNTVSKGERAHTHTLTHKFKLSNSFHCNDKLTLTLHVCSLRGSVLQA